MDDRPAYFGDMLFCGSNKPVGEHTLSDKIAAVLKGAPVDFQTPAEVTFKNGVKRVGIPTVYLPYLDTADDIPHNVLGLTFKDTQQLEIVRFRGYQQSDPNPFFRLCGNEIPHRINLNYTPRVFDHLGIPNTNLINKHVLAAIEKHNPGFVNWYIKPFLLGYEKLLREVANNYDNIWLPLESERLMWENKSINNEGFLQVAGLAHANKLNDSVSMRTSPPIKSLDMEGELR